MGNNNLIIYLRPKLDIMTLGEFLTFLNQNPIYIIFYVVIVPFAAVLAGFFGKDEGHLSPWKYLYSTLVYLVCIPGIFAITLNIYLFLFERKSIFSWQLNTQILPIFLMVVTLLIIRRNVDLRLIPGFQRLSGLLMMIAAVMVIMWVVDRTHIIFFSRLPIGFLVIVFVLLLLGIRFGWSRLFSK